MEYPIQHIEKILSGQTPHAATIYQQMGAFRAMPIESSIKYNCMCTFVAFGNTTDRTLLLSCLVYALQPELIYSSYVKSYENKEYETILLLKKKIPIKMIEDFLEMFRMSTCVIPFERLMSDEMTTSIARDELCPRRDRSQVLQRQHDQITRYCRLSIFGRMVSL